MRAPLNRDDVLCHFSAGFRPRRHEMVGLEYELLGVEEATGRAIPYDGSDASIISVLDGLCRDFGWHPVGGEPLLELRREGSRITLEPGSQLELSLRPHRKISHVEAELLECVGELETTSEALGIRFLPVGQQPLTTPDEITIIPKERYRIMTRYLPTQGDLALWMMRLTAGMQVNLDVHSPEDAAEALRVALGISSVVTALFANSPLTSGEPNGWLSHRGHIWMHVDPDRCSIPVGLTDPGATVADYLDWALSAGMFFVERGHQLFDMTGTSFAEFLDGGRCGIKPTLADWESHLTTLFPEARLKNYLEIRCADSNSPELALGYCALAVGLIYGGPQVRREALSLIEGPSHQERLAFHEACAREGLAARTPDGRTAAEITGDLIEIADRGLADRRPADRPYLEPVRDLQRSKRCPAQRILAVWNGWDGGLWPRLAEN